MPNSSYSTIAQITRNGQFVQEKKGPISIGEVLTTDGLERRTAGATGSREIPGLYIHVPFCFHKCHYCDFYSIVDSRDRQDVFVSRLIEELAASARYLTNPIQTLFIGGGTPTLLSVELWQPLIQSIHRLLRRDIGCEWTVEANPETVTRELAETLAAGGINRISIGCQSFNPIHLKTLERWHEPCNVHRSVETLRAAGIHNINLDLIFAIPGQSLDEWMADLEEVLSLSPSHLSCYSLMYEPNTPLTQKLKSGAIDRVDEDLEAAMYEATIDRLHAAGFEHYEISNWARRDARETARDEPPIALPSAQRAIGEERGGRAFAAQEIGGCPEFAEANRETGDCPQFRCHHNMLYWTNANWWALGPSASGHVSGIRWKNVARLQEYLDHGPLPPITDVEQVDEDTRIGEQLMLGLRLIDGLTLPDLDRLLSRGCRADERRRLIDRHVANTLLEKNESCLRLTRRGLLVADAVLADLI